MGPAVRGIVNTFLKGSKIPKCHSGTRDHTFVCIYKTYIYIHTHVQTICEMRHRTINYNQLLMNINEPPHVSTSSSGPGVGVGMGPPQLPWGT